MPRADFPTAAARRLLGPVLPGLLLLAALLLQGGAARAQELRVGLPGGPESLDPHTAWSRPQMAAMRNIFGTLVRRGPDMAIEPELAESWQRIDATTWEFRLRQGVRWHDNSDFTAEDVQHSIERVQAMTAGGPINEAVAGISVVVIIDPYTVRLRTQGPAPTLLAELDRLFITQSKPNPTLRGGDGAVGTGPYRYGDWSPGRELMLERWEAYNGPEQPHFERVTYREIPDAAARVAALRAGEVDLISEVPVAEVPGLGQAPGLRVVRGRSVFVFLLHPDGRELSPAATDHEGRPLGRNPFADVRVRQAVSLALDRAALVRGPLQGMGEPAEAPVPYGFFGVPRDLPPLGYNPITARRLLAQAGFARGFRVPLPCTQGRFDGDAALCAEIGRALAEIGIIARPAPMPADAYFTGFERGDYSLSLNAWGTLSGDATYMLAGLLHQRGVHPALGGFNRMRYANPALDRLTLESLGAGAESERRLLVEQAVRRAVDDLAVIPVANIGTVWAINAGRVSFTPRMDEEVPALSLRAPEPARAPR